MKYYKKIALIYLLFISSLLTAQNIDSVKNQNIVKESYFTLDAFSSINTFSPRWRIGYIRSINNKWKLGINLGYGNRNLSFSDFGNKIEEDYELWEIRPELYHIFKQKGKSIIYYSIEVFYINHSDVFHDYYYYQEEGGEISYDQAGYQRYKYGFNLNIGEFISFGKRFRLNIFTGLGVRIRDNTFSNVIDPRPTETFIDMFDFNEFKKVEGADFGLNYSIGLKLLFK